MATRNTKKKPMLKSKSKSNTKLDVYMKKSASKNNKSNKTKKKTALSNLFSFPKTKAVRNFETSFKYGSVDIDINSTVNNKTVKVNYKIMSDKFNLTGVATFSPGLFSDFEGVFKHLISNIHT